MVRQIRDNLKIVHVTYSSNKFCGKITCSLLRDFCIQLSQFNAVFVNFEGVWGAGVATSSVNVDDVPLGSDNKSWILTSDGTTIHNGQIVDRVKEKVSEGSIVVSVY